MNPPNSLVDSFNITMKAAAIRAIRAIRSPTWECMKSGINDTNAKKNRAAMSASWLWLLIPRCHRRRWPARGCPKMEYTTEIYGDIGILWDIDILGIQQHITWYYVYVCIYIHIYIYLSSWWFQPLWKIWKSVGMMTFPIWWESHNPVMFQTTNQIYYNTVIHINIHSNTSWMLCTTAGRALNCSQILDPTMVVKSCHHRW